MRLPNLYLFSHSPGGDWDILIGAGAHTAYHAILTTTSLMMLAASSPRSAALDR